MNFSSMEDRKNYAEMPESVKLTRAEREFLEEGGKSSKVRGIDKIKETLEMQRKLLENKETHSKL